MGMPLFGVIAPHPPIMVPAVGGSDANVTSSSLEALAHVRRAVNDFDPQTLVIMSPHAPGFSDAFAIDDSPRCSGSLSQFGDTTTHEWDGDSIFAQRLVAELGSRGVPTSLRSSHPRLHAGGLDHATIVPLSFLDPSHRRAIVVLSLSGLPYSEHRTVGEAVAHVASELERRTIFVASGDLSHRLTPEAPAGYSPRALELDRAIVGYVESGDLAALAHIDPALVDAGGECGLRSFVALGGYCGFGTVPSRVLSYEGPWGVGYLTAVVGAAGLASLDAPRDATPHTGLKGGEAGSEESEIVSLARAAVEAHVDSRPAPPAVLHGPEYPSTAGVFVSLHREGDLRGCIGTILPTQATLAEEVVHNAVEAAVRDPRFPPVSRGELATLDVKVDVLHSPSACTKADLDPATYGVIVTSGWRRGLLLPDLPGVDDVDTQVNIALRKAGIRDGDSCSIERFKVERYT